MIPKPMQDAIEKLDLPQSLLLQGLLLEHSMKLIGFEKTEEPKPKSKILKL